VPVAEAPPEPIAADDDVLAEHRTFRPRTRRGFEVERTGPDRFRVMGEGIERLLARYDPENDEAMAYFEHRLGRIGVIRELEEQGFEPGDEVEIGGVVFELDPGA
jgi:GTP-binding protein